MSAAPSRDLLTRLPKAELHCHLDGSVRASTLLALATEYGLSMPRTTAAELADYMLVRDARKDINWKAIDVKKARTQTELAFGGAAMNRVSTPAAAMAKAAPMSVRVGAPVPSLATSCQLACVPR